MIHAQSIQRIEKENLNVLQCYDPWGVGTLFAGQALQGLLLSHFSRHRLVCLSPVDRDVGRHVKRDTWAQAMTRNG